MGVNKQTFELMIALNSYLQVLVVTMTATITASTESRDKGLRLNPTMVINLILMDTQSALLSINHLKTMCSCGFRHFKMQRQYNNTPQNFKWT